jgi:tRNA(adenine34) deaminase
MNEFPRQTDEGWMAAALAEAEAAGREGEVPVGAVVVRDGAVVAAAHNRTIGLNDPTAHAEILALRQAAAAVGNYRLPDCDLYVTLEPCAMCVGACVQARVRRLVFGAPDPRWGGLGPRLDLGRPGLFNHDLAVTGGVLEGPCRERLQDFFGRKRKP